MTDSLLQELRDRVSRAEIIDREFASVLAASNGVAESHGKALLLTRESLVYPAGWLELPEIASLYAEVKDLIQQRLDELVERKRAEFRAA